VSEQILNGTSTQ